ncbi:MAG: TolC family protein [Candidatus Poribacteria bacterium]|nr:TolC family protein [Candidatus Poribacteria bacterium]
MHVSRFRQRFLVGTLVLVLCNCMASAQGARTLTLEESIEIARQTNLSIQTIQEVVKSAEAQVRSERAALLPKVSISGSYRYTKDLPTSVLEASGGFGPLDPGAEMPPPLDTAGGADTNVIELEFGAHHNFQGELSLRQPIFVWGRYYYNYQSAKLSLEAVQKELDAAYNQLVLDVSEAFYSILLAMEFVKVAKQTVELVENQLQIARNLFDAGASTNFDVLRAKVLLANAKSQLIRARNQTRIATDAYKNILNIDLAEDVEVQGSLDRPMIELNLESLIQQAMAERPEMHQFEFNEQAAKKRVDVAKTGNRPDLSFFTNYQIEENERLEEMNRIWNVGFALNFPIFDGFATRAAVQQTKATLKQTQLGKQQMMDAIEFEVRSAYLNLLEAKALIEVQKETVEQAHESVRIANLRYENGMITSVELTDAQIARAQAEVNRLQSLHDYAVGLARLEKANGHALGN